ncbi:MAG TPA: glycoside hydrolase family 15 protein [Ktedonobacterales bacterium]
MARSRERVVQTRLDGSEPRYWPIESYGVIGDCRTAALLAPNGSFDWLCLPHFDSQASLCRMLDADHGGYFQIRPEGACSAAMRYVPATNVLETTFTADSGQLTTLDFMPIRKRRPREQALAALASFAPTALHSERAHLERDVGNDVAAAHRIDRIITCDRGEATLSITLKLTPDYARRRARVALDINPSHTVSSILYDDEGHYFVFVAKPMSGRPGSGAAKPFEVSAHDGHLNASVHMSAGERIGVALNFARDEREARELLQRLLERDLDDDLAETLDYWQTWSDQCAYDGKYTDDVLRSALALKLCVFEPSGAIVAAPTTSLPEDVGGERNWDYRYTWLRDSSFTLQALGLLGYHSEARDYFHFLHDLHLRHGADLRVLYTLRGESDSAAAERDLSQLEGYKASRPVRVGNGAATQRQMDIYGELADCALLYAEALGYCTGERSREGPRDLRDLLSVIADFVADHWQDPDRGIWEVRGPERAFVYSRVMCWVALDRAMRMTKGHVDEQRFTRWAEVAMRIRADVHAHGYNEQLRSFTQAYGVDTVDAANFRIALAKFLSVDDERMRSTITTTGRILASDEALIYRYRPVGDAPANANEDKATDDGLPGKEGAFLACAFWYVSDLALIGEVDEARRRFERLLQYASPLGLFSEEVDPNSSALLGNFPQAFTHIGLINAAHNLRMAQKRAAQSS